MVFLEWCNLSNNTYHDFKLQYITGNVMTSTMKYSTVAIFHNFLITVEFFLYFFYNFINHNITILI